MIPTKITLIKFIIVFADTNLQKICDDTENKKRYNTTKYRKQYVYLNFKI